MANSKRRNNKPQKPHVDGGILDGLLTGRTSSGFEFRVPKARFGNMELIDAMAEMDSNPLGLSKVVLAILGADQRKRLYDHLRTDGMVPADRVEAEMVDILNAYGKKGKNS